MSHNDIAIRVENLAKRYRIGLAEKKSTSMREVAGAIIKGPFHYLQNRLREPEPEELIWALQDVSFEIKQGEVVGIIGRNGAGKSTLLKILSRITEPTKGHAEIYGRIGSLLEVGTGFHPELTGRENIYLNGAILGMRRVEVARKFDEIVAFSEIEKFIDTPVKRYSSGMYVRLAFAVAAHLESELLLVDEVLAVGDLAFQKKCLGKLDNVSKHGGRTVLLVSHNMQAIRALCSRSILIDSGEMLAAGSTRNTLQKYYEILKRREVHEDSERYGSGDVRFTEIRLEDERGRERFDFLIGDTIRFIMSYKVFKPIDRLAISLGLRSGTSREPLGSTEKFWISLKRLYPGDTGTVIIEFQTTFFRPGEYPLYFILSDRLRLFTFDFADDVTVPLSLYTDKEPEVFGFDTSASTGFYTFKGKLVKNSLSNSPLNDSLEKGKV